MPNRRTAAARRYHPLLLAAAGLALLLGSLLLAVRMVDAGAALGKEPVWRQAQSNAPAWLAMVDSPAQLYTEYPLARLAGRLIHFGAVNAPNCEGAGLLASGEANECGLKTAMPQVIEWQNRFNSAIYGTSQKYEVPPRLMKNLFAWESQFWPETIFVNTYEFGLGHITLNGADSALRWNPDLYQQVCRASYSAETCAKEYGDQDDAIRSGLMGVYVQLAKADCPTCRYNLDLQRAEASIPIFAQTIKANEYYVRYAIKSFYGVPAGAVVGEEDLWRFTLVSYNAGPGCFRNALGELYYREVSVSWDNLKSRLEPGCRGSIPYVDFISRTDAYVPERPQPTSPPPEPTAEPTPVEPTPVAPPVTVDLSLPHSGELVMMVAEGQEEQALQALEDLGISQEQVGQPIQPAGAQVVQVEAEALADVLAELNSSESFLFAEPNYLVEAAAINPKDEFFSLQTNLPYTGVVVAWNAIDDAKAYPGTNVVVAVLDTGIDMNHPDLAGNLLTGWNTVANNSNVEDDNGHGTQVAGVIGALIDNNKIGIAGIAPNAKLMPVKVLNASGAGTHADVAAGIYYAVDHGAKVINLGFAGPGNSRVLQNAINHAVTSGVVVVAAAGNDGLQKAYYPAAYDGVIAVSAVNQATGTLWTNSTYGDHISLAAPGVSIVTTTWNDGYTNAAPVSGTSMSAAHVSGAAALLLGQPGFTTAQAVRGALIKNATDLGDPGRDALYGFGLLRVDLALNYTGTPSTPAPVVAIKSPAPGAFSVKPAPITFSATAVDADGKDVSAGLVWESNIDGRLGSGATFSIDWLTPAAHTITASVQVAGATGSDSLTLTVTTADNSPHGGFTASTDGCVICHNSHAGSSVQNGLTGSIPAHSAGFSNEFCLACHSSGAKTVSTHSNLSTTGVVKKQEGNFELLCIQCHDSHGATPNLFLIRQYPLVGKTMSLSSLTPVSAPVAFDSDLLTQTNNLCLSCHSEYTMNHQGGADHEGGIDYSATSCISCHPHSADGSAATRDGFMPVRGLQEQGVSAQSQPEAAPLGFLDSLLKLFQPD